jgi:hypothetical protein
MGNALFALMLVCAGLALGVLLGVSAVAPRQLAAPAAVDGGSPDDGPRSVIATHPPAYAGTPVAVDYDASAGFQPGRPVLRLRP